MPENDAEKPGSHIPPGPDRKPAKTQARTQAQVGKAVDDAQHQAEAMERDVARISTAHLNELLSDDDAVLVEHIDDPELTSEDRNRLLNTIRTRRSSQHRRQTSPRRTPWRRIPMPSLRTFGKSLVALGILAAVLWPVLRNTMEIAVVTRPFRTEWRYPNGETRLMTVQPGERFYARRWLRAIPIAVAWIDSQNGYAIAPVFRDRIAFPDFPYLD